MTDEAILKNLIFIRNDYELKELHGYAERIQNAIDLIENQGRMIDLMAEQLTSPINGKEWVIKYYEDRVENEKNV